ncbi:MAG: hypothetical protein PHQ27_08785, partial [Victivallales bacterium]|nr:hypothetical protein [Victivallales bacterium]
MDQKIQVAVVGASGYAGEELIRLLLRHPLVNIRIITSRQHDGKAVETVFPRFMGSNLKFTAPDAARIARECEVAFLALPHGLATEFALPLLQSGVK